MVETGTLLQNRYLIERQIGEGGMGAVYLAVDQKFGSRVAIKETFYQTDDLGEAFEREARLLNNLHHPILPHVSDYFIEDGKHFLLMEFIEGEDLSEILERGRAFAVEEVLRWTNELLDALDYLHSQEPPIIHRDIKPNNLKLTTRGNIVLLDFGLAKLNQTGTVGMKSVFGYSRRYSPLEQIQGTGTDARSDIFALGATVYHLLTGKPPVDVLARASAIVAGKSDPLQLVSEIREEVPLAVAQVLQTAMALNADRRFNSAKAMRKALEFAVHTDSVSNEQPLNADPIIVEESEQPVSTPSENESFPALEAFAAEAAPLQIEIPVAKPSKPLPKFKAAKKAEKQPQGDYKPLLTMAACLALILFGIFAFWSFSYQASVENETSQTPVVQSSPVEEKAVHAQTPEMPVAAATVVSEPTPEPSAAQTKIKAATKNKIAAEPQKTPVEAPAQPEVVGKPMKQQAKTPVPRQTQAPRRRNTEAVAKEQPSVSSIETIMTGMPSGRLQRQQRQMNDEEKEDLRRRRSEDILRHNRKPQ